MMDDAAICHLHALPRLRLLPRLPPPHPTPHRQKALLYFSSLRKLHCYSVVKLLSCCSSTPTAIFFLLRSSCLYPARPPSAAYPSFIIASSLPLFARTGLLLRRFFIIQVTHYICCRSLLRLHHSLVAFRIITELFDLFIPHFFSLFSSHFCNPSLYFSSLSIF